MFGRQKDESAMRVKMTCMCALNFDIKVWKVH